MTEDITVKVMHSVKEPAIYITGNMIHAQRMFDEAALVLERETGNVKKVELWKGDRLVKYADKDGVFDVKYTKAGVYQGVEKEAAE